MIEHEINFTILESVICQIELIKKEWLDKKIELIYLSPKINELLEKIEDVDVKKNLKSYVDNKILLDSNVENSNNVVVNTSMMFVTLLMSLLAQILAVFYWVNMDSFVIIILVLFNIGIDLMVFPILIKHRGKYAREKSFYEIVLKGL
ncbi:MAG: hypothetical protein R3Y54_06110 [Eubacteriales bacterium]